MRDKDGHFIMTKGTIHQEDITLINIYAPNQGTPKYVKQWLTELKGGIDKNIIIIGNLNTHWQLWIDHLKIGTINREISTLKDTLDQLDIINISEPFISKHQIINSSLVYMEHSQG